MNIKKYIELVYGKESDLNKIENIEERKKIAAEQCGIEVPDRSKIGKQVILFMREMNHNRHSLLVTKEELFMESLEVLREPLAETKDDDKRLKNIKLKGDLNELCNRLEEEIEKLRISLYTEEYKEEAKRVVSIEERLSKKSS